MKLVDGLAEEDYGVSVSAMLQYVVDYLDDKEMLEDHVFTFPDGSPWAATWFNDPPQPSDIIEF